MFRKLDTTFLSSLDDMELLEKRLHVLSIARRLWIFAMIAGVGAFFYTSTHLLPSNELKPPALSSSINDIARPYFELCHSVILLFLILASFFTALIHCEIRTLLAFSKLN